MPNGMSTMARKLQMPEPKPIRNWRDAYRVQDAGEVSRFMVSHPFLVSLLSDTRSEIEKYFPDTRPRLELATDPEDGEQQLVLAIGTSLPSPEAVATLKRFDGGWWRKHLGKAEGKLCITLR